MSVHVGDFVLETSNSPGTGGFSLAGAPTGRVTFGTVFATGTKVYYAATDGTQSEVGYGTYTTGAPATISRDTVLFTSTQGTTSPTVRNFTGTVRVYSVIPAVRAVSTDDFVTTVVGSALGLAMPNAKIQGGLGTTNASGVLTVTFPNTFAALFSVIAIPVVGAAAAIAMEIGSNSVSSFNAISVNSATGAALANITFYWLAFGT